jgi:hypothetical protein
VKAPLNFAFTGSLFSCCLQRACSCCNAPQARHPLLVAFPTANQRDVLNAWCWPRRGCKRDARASAFALCFASSFKRRDVAALFEQRRTDNGGPQALWESFSRRAAAGSTAFARVLPPHLK